ncbi:TadE family protein [Desulfocucumis palustris]|uniref:TadE family protein n=1 Tax=Desulfocucumis palustris TaxID=1898651 RepID=UPI000CEA5E2E|nr:TadE family protein [Desulfocucumis palustris]
MEMALAFPILLGLVLGTINLAILLNNNITVAAAARDATRVVTATANIDEGITAAQKSLDVGLIGGGESSINIYLTSSSLVSEITYNVPILIPGFAKLLGGNITDTMVSMKYNSSTYVERAVFEPPPPSPYCGDWYNCSGGGWWW